MRCLLDCFCLLCRPEVCALKQLIDGSMGQEKHTQPGKCCQEQENVPHNPARMKGLRWAEGVTPAGVGRVERVALAWSTRNSRLEARRRGSQARPIKAGARAS